MFTANKLSVWGCFGFQGQGPLGELRAELKVNLYKGCDAGTVGIQWALGFWLVRAVRLVSVFLGKLMVNRGFD